MVAVLLAVLKFLPLDLFYFCFFLFQDGFGLLPTHIAAIIGVLGARHKDNLMVWLLAIYGGVGALNPVLIVVDHIGTHTVRWPLAFLYPFVWVIQLISFGALSVTGAISTHRAKLLAVA